jgi:hypothetical protein
VARKVGPKDQVAIEQRIREQLGIRPGIQTAPQMVYDPGELRFLPAEHTRSLAGAARPYIRRWPTLKELDDCGAVWAEEARDKFRIEESERRA